MKFYQCLLEPLQVAVVFVVMYLIDVVKFQTNGAGVGLVRLSGGKTSALMDASTRQAFWLGEWKNDEVVRGLHEVAAQQIHREPATGHMIDSSHSATAPCSSYFL
ncbi:hypothetical protein [Pistricoccus aurantiacus]|uniref:hypothetical protein n=1 Tax=Pistricoccus aurantiacus TaxID=1883414 RepID=UPI003641B1EE